MSMKPVNFVGARRVAYLPSWIPVSIRIVDHPRTRSFQKYTHQVKSTYHDTGNPRTRAEGEYQWLRGGRQGGVVGGYQFILDDGIIIQTGPLDEISWHAGTPEGNKSFGAEHAFGAGTDWMTSLQVGAALHGALIEMQDLNPDDAAVLHQFWTGKYCSAQILNRRQWSVVKTMIRSAYNAARAARNGQVAPSPAPVLLSPMPVLVDGTRWTGDRTATVNGHTFHAQKQAVTVNVDALNGRQYASTISGFTTPGRVRGQTIQVLGWVGGELVGEEPRWWVASDFTRYWAGGTVEKPQEWTDHTDSEQAQPGVHFVNGRAYYPLIDPETGKLGRELVISGPANLRRWADTTSPITGGKQKGAETVADYWTLGTEVNREQVWFVLNDGERDVLGAGARIWAGNTDYRPQ